MKCFEAAGRKSEEAQSVLRGHVDTAKTSGSAG